MHTAPGNATAPGADWRYCEEPALGFALDLEDMDLPDDLLAAHAGGLEAALAAMRGLEAGAIANPDEGRMVGHYWLRDPDRAPSPEIRDALRAARRDVERFAAAVHAEGRLRSFLVIGIGGSALGPQLVAAALGDGDDRLRPFFLDNTDPDGCDRVLAQLAAAPGGLAATLVVVISKSGGTKETRNGMLEVQAAFARAGLPFAPHAVAVTGDGSELHRTARKEGWLAIFPMWDHIGGRTSVLSPVGLLPAALQGVDIDGLLAGAAEMDALTRRDLPDHNPGALLALSWLSAGARGKRDMVVLPYKDRLELFSRYLQQLVMESLGKERDLLGRVVHQGIAVYGNKGSTDQHAYVQQLRDGLDNFFATFIQVRRDRAPGAPPFFVEEQVTSGDYLQGFLLGTRQALRQGGRLSLTITLPEVSARTLGQLIALFERAVGLYAALCGINAYHQPGVEAGKKAAADVLALQRRLLAALAMEPEPLAVLLQRAGAANSAEQRRTAFEILEHLAANGRVRRERPAEAGAGRFESRYGRVA